MDSERLARFWNKVEVKSEEECWLWTASVNSKGYGSFLFAPKKTALAHKISWALAHNNGVLSGPKEHVMHSCDVRRCVNPNHLSLGTAADNNRDARQKGRSVNPIHSENPYCRNGHPRTEENTHPKYRTCIICTRDSNRKSAQERRKRDREAFNAYHRDYYRRKLSAESRHG